MLMFLPKFLFFLFKKNVPRTFIIILFTPAPKENITPFSFACLIIYILQIAHSKSMKTRQNAFQLSLDNG